MRNQPSKRQWLVSVEPERYLLPNGKSTRSVSVYCRQWRSLARRVSQRLRGMRLYLIAFDPGIVFARKGGGPPVSLTAELAQAIAAIPHG